MVKTIHSSYVFKGLMCQALLDRIVFNEKINNTIMMIITLPHLLRTSLNVLEQRLRLLEKLVPCPTSSLRSEFYPQNINYMSVVKFFTRLEFERITSFFKVPLRHYKNRGWIIAVLVCITIIHSGSAWCSDDALLWKEFRSGSAFVLLRHAIAPGTGDPDHFVLGDCLTQRNLSDVGRGQATSIGEQFRANKIDKARVLSSQWCRCQETAELLKLGSVEELPLLNSFFQKYQRSDSQTEGLRRWIGEQNLRQPLVLVTHQVNITSLTNYYPASGELVFARRLDSGEIAFIGSIKTD